MCCYRHGLRHFYAVAQQTAASARLHPGSTGHGACTILPGPEPKATMRIRIPLLRGALALLLLGPLLPSMACADAHIIYLTRHAEKESAGQDPALTSEGQVRAANIAALLRKADIGHIFSTAYARTRQTAQPLSAALAIPVQTYDPAHLAAFARQLRALPGNALVVGHSNTTPDLVRALGGNPGSAMEESDFDRLYQLIIGTDGTVSTVLLTSLPAAGAAKQ